MDDAACAEVTPDIFFPEVGSAPLAQVRKICAGCPVSAERLGLALCEHIVTGKQIGRAHV